MYQPVAGLVFFGSFAWAYGVVQAMGCFEVFDKVALVLNLVRTPPDRRLTAFPSTKGNRSLEADANVAKLLNVLAVQNRDFSLLQTGHQLDDPYIGHDGFDWAALPMQGDPIADFWRNQIYEIGEDPTVSLNPAGLRLRGPIERIVFQQSWEIKRAGDKLHVAVGHFIKVVEADWLEQPDTHPLVSGTAYDREPQLSRLRDILYAIEAFNAVDIWPTFLPTDETWTLRGRDDGFRSYNKDSLRSRMIKEYIRPGTTQRVMATGSAFLHRDHESRSMLSRCRAGFVWW
ncbi:hypothetical protein BST61_g7897 [Cercospora zeina]